MPEQAHEVIPQPALNGPTDAGDLPTWTGGIANYPALVDRYFMARRPHELNQPAPGALPRLKHWWRGPAVPRIVTASFCRHAYGAAAITDDGQLWLAYETRDTNVAVLLSRCDQLSTAIRETLRRYDHLLLLEMVFNVAVTLFAIMDGAGTSPQPDGTHAPADSETSRLLKEQERALAGIERRLRATMVRRGRQRYVYGMLFGVLFTLVVLGLLGADGNVTDDGFKALMGIDPPTVSRTLLVCMFVGGLGSVVSVLQRLTAGKLAVDASARIGTQYLFGAARPCLGAALGGVAYLLIKADFLTFLDTPESGAERTYFFAAIAFIAGFSERFMQDAIASTEERLSIAAPAHAGATNDSASEPDPRQADAQTSRSDVAAGGAL
jgi:hypothetical protein